MKIKTFEPVTHSLNSSYYEHSAFLRNHISSSRTGFYRIQFTLFLIGLAFSSGRKEVGITNLYLGTL